MNRKAMFERRKSDFSRICSTFRTPNSSRSSKSSILITLAGKANGSSADIIYPTQHTPKIIPN